MASFRKKLQRLFGRSGPGGSQSRPFMDPEEAKRQGYHVTPGGLQWSPAARRAVDKSKWKPCHACGRLIPIKEDWVTRIVEVRTGGQRTYDPDGTVIEEGVTYPIEKSEKAGTWTYVCSFCNHCHVGTGSNDRDIRIQTTCHECGTELGNAYQCPKCSFPRAWMNVQCPYCGNRQPVDAPHWVGLCDMFVLECVKCECVFSSFCIC